MSKYNEMPKGDNRPVPENEKGKFKKNAEIEKAETEKNGSPESAGSQDARRHAESSKHGKR